MYHLALEVCLNAAGLVRRKLSGHRAGAAWIRKLEYHRSLWRLVVEDTLDVLQPDHWLAPRILT